MPSSPARRLVLVCVALEALLNLVLVLPGGPSYESTTIGVVWLVIEALLLWRLWHGSVFASFVLLVAALVTLPLFVLTAPEFDAASLLVSFISLAELGALLTPWMPASVWSRKPAAAG